MRRHCLLWMSHSRTVSSCEPESSRLPSVETDKQVTWFLWRKKKKGSFAAKPEALLICDYCHLCLNWGSWKEEPWIKYLSHCGLLPAIATVFPSCQGSSIPSTLLAISSWPCYACLQGIYESHGIFQCLKRNSLTASNLTASHYAYFCQKGTQPQEEKKG